MSTKEVVGQDNRQVEEDSSVIALTKTRSRTLLYSSLSLLSSLGALSAIQISTSPLS